MVSHRGDLFKVAADGTRLERLISPLQGKLLFIHGMLDTTVPFKTTVRMMEKLMLLGKDFDIAVAPNAPHGWSSSEHYAVFLNRKLQPYFDRHLGPGPRDRLSAAR